MQGAIPPPDPNMPQPPQQQPAPDPTQGATLGQANEPPGNPYLEQFLQMHQALSQQAQALKEPLVPPQPGPSLLESLGTFGIANLKHIADENTRREENYRRHQHNLAIDTHVNDMALKATDAQATAAGLMGRANLAQQGFQLRLLEFQNKLQEQARQDAENKIKGQLPLPKTPQEARMREAQGYEADPAHPGKMRLVLNPATNAYELPPDSPMAHKLAQVGGGGGGTGAAPSSGRLPGESDADYVDRMDVKKKMAVPTTSTRTMSEMAPKVLGLVDQVEQSMRNIQAGPLKSRAQEFASGTLGIGNAPFTKYRTDVGLLQTSLMRMHVGARGGEQIMKHFKSLLNAGVQSPENMQAALDEIRDYAKSMAPGSATTNTTTSTTPPSTGSPTQPTGATGVTPGGVRFRVIQ